MIGKWVDSGKWVLSALESEESSGGGGGFRGFDYGKFVSSESLQVLFLAFRGVLSGM